MIATTERLAREGRVWLRGLIDAEEQDVMRRQFTGRPGWRAAPDGEFAHWLARCRWVAALRALWPGLQPRRVLGFEKATEGNWSLGWHQDRVIAVAKRCMLPGATEWSTKSGIPHCDIGAELAGRMFFARAHLDQCSTQAGGMEYAVGSHRHGIVRQEDIAAQLRRYPRETERARPGDVLILNMLTLHRSGVTTRRSKRRVLRVDFADFSLPGGAVWAYGPAPGPQ